jgi:hypothetical protein
MKVMNTYTVKPLFKTRLSKRAAWAHNNLSVSLKLNERIYWYFLPISSLKLFINLSETLKLLAFKQNA